MTSPRRAEAPVVVGVETEAAAGAAVEWASAEAAARRCPLRLVHAVHDPLGDPCGLAPPLDGDVVAATGRAVLGVAVGRARSVASEIEISTLLLRGDPAHVLLDHAAGAQLLVLGGRARPGLRRLSRSVCDRTVNRSPCPVVVVRPPQTGFDLGRYPPRIVVGISAAATSTRAVGFALQAARQRGIPLIAVHGWAPDRPDDLEGVADPAAVAQLVARNAVERTLDRWRPEFADVAVHTALVRDDPVRALISASRGAAMLVIGSQDRRHLPGSPTSISRTVLRHAGTPLAVIRPGGIPDEPTTGSLPAAERATRRSWGWGPPRPRRSRDGR